MATQKKQFSSRMARFEEKKLRTRLLLALLGTGAIILLVIIFGFKLFIGFSLLLSQMGGKGDDTTLSNGINVILPPVLDPLPLATSSGKIIITGRGQNKTNVVLYINEEESKKTEVSEDGTFIISSITLPEGQHAIKAKTQNSKGNLSEFSNTIRTLIKRKPPKLEVTKPNDNDTINGEENILSVEGKTEEDTDIRVNDRFVVVKSDGSFNYPYPLDEGENNIEIKAIDRAGNMTQIFKKVTYHK